MTREAAAGWILLAWLGAVGIVTARQVTGKGPQTSAAAYLPQPNVYLGSAVLFTLLWGGSLLVPGLAVAVAIGVDFGLLATPYLKGKPGLLDQVSTWLEKVSPPAPAASSGGTSS